MRKGASQELRIGKERCRRAVDGKCFRDDDCSGLTQQKVGGTAAAPAVLRCALGEASAAPRPRLGLRYAPAPRPTAGGALNLCAAAAVVIDL